VAPLVPANAEIQGRSSVEATADDTASLIERVAPDHGDVELLREGEGGWEAPDSSTTVPRDAEDPITLSTSSGGSLEISLPDTVDVGSGQEAADGTVVYPSLSGDTDMAVQALESGALRVQSVIKGPESKHEFSYTVGGGFVPAVAADGTFWAVGFDLQGHYHAYSIGAAWAQDARGQAVETHYEIRGVDLVQVVTPSPSAAYPIVADPTWQWYSAAYGAGFSKSETRDFTSYGAVTGFCAVLPGPFGAACAVLGAQWFLQAQLAANADSGRLHLGRPGAHRSALELVGMPVISSPTS
jgi:hypothetical protein